MYLLVLKDYINDMHKFDIVECGKKCWFLKNNHCILEEKNKPLGCKMYPVNVWKLTENLIVADVIPCPHMNLSEVKKIKYSDAADIILDFESSFGIAEGNLNKRIVRKESFDIHAKIKKYEQWKLSFIRHTELQKDNEQDRIIKMLFTQVAIVPVIFFAPLDKLDDLFDYYMKNYIRLKTMGLFDNIYNYYIIIRNNTIKHTIYKHYFPYNKRVYEHLSNADRQKYCKIYETGNIKESEQEDLYNIFFNSEGTQWSAI